MLLTRDGCCHVAVLFEQDEAIAVVLRGEALVDLVLVLPDALFDVAGEADVEGVAATGDYVGVEASGHGE